MCGGENVKREVLGGINRTEARRQRELKRVVVVVVGRIAEGVVKRRCLAKPEHASLKKPTVEKKGARLS